MEYPVVFFDDVCVLCSRSVQFILKHDRRGAFRFAAVDSDLFREKVAPSLPEGLPDSVILLVEGRVFTRSSASLRISGRLRFPINLAVVGLAVPRFLRNLIYDWIARNRYRWFGKMDTCYMPDPELRERFLT